LAILFDGRLLITDAANVPINGGKARIYDANTTDLTSVFSDAALATPLANPVVANSSGITPQIYAAEGTIVDMQWLTAANVEVPGRSYEDLTFLGSDSGDFARTVTGSGRITITGSAGSVLIQAGSPSPDSTGGALTLEGQAGTQLDSLTLDAALTNTTGPFTENSKKLPSIVYTASTTFTAAATVDIALPNDPTGCRAYDVELFDVILSDAGVLVQARFSYDGGATFKSGATDYTFANVSYDASTNQFVTSVDVDDTKIDMSGPASTNTANRPGMARVRIITPDSGSFGTVVTYETAFWNTDSILAPARGAGMGLGGYGRATHVRFLASAGTLTGKYRVEPRRGYGEA
jgi:hypothetical protein